MLYQQMRGTYGMTVLLHSRIKLLFVVQMICIQFVQFHDVGGVGLFLCGEGNGQWIQGFFQQYVQLAGCAFLCESYQRA